MPDSSRPFSIATRQQVGAPPDALARDAIGVVIRRLSALPACPEVQELLPKAADFLRQAQVWPQSPLSPRGAREWDVLMMRVLGLHVAVTKLERGTPGKTSELAQP